MRTPFRPLRDGEILDAGYYEFMVTPAYALELLNGGMTHVNGLLVHLEIVDELPGVNAVLIRWKPHGAVHEYPEGTYVWQLAA
jgi:hypothetical protein